MGESFFTNGAITGSGRSCFLIAEAGVNHNGEIALAKQLIEIAARAGASAVKFQSFSTPELVANNAPLAEYQQRALKDTDTPSQIEMLKRYELTEEDHRILADHAQKHRIPFLSSPFGIEQVALLVRVGVPALKLASGEITNFPLLRAAAATGRPILLSTGMSELAEVERAIRELESGGAKDITVLHCVSNYPADPIDTNLRAMETIQKAFGYPVGLSDHSLGIEISLAAVALGATVIEKHFTIDRALPGPDHQASLEPLDLKALVSGIRNILAALGDGEKRPRPSEIPTRAVARRSIVAACSISEGAVLTSEMLTLKRPGTGLGPDEISKIIGRRTRVAISPDTIIRDDLLE